MKTNPKQNILISQNNKTKHASFFFSNVFVNLKKGFVFSVHTHVGTTRRPLTPDGLRRLHVTNHSLQNKVRWGGGAGSKQGEDVKKHEHLEPHDVAVYFFYLLGGAPP